MLTPKFTVSQDDAFVIVFMKTPFIKTSELEYYIEEKEFKFYAKPYFLKLNFPHQITENGKEELKYDISTGEIAIKLPKFNTGQFFEDLDLLTKLLPNQTLPEKKLIEVLGNEQIPSETQESINWEEHRESDTFDWSLPADDIVQLTTSTTATYGFNQQFSGLGSHIKSVAQNILDIDDLDNSTVQSRRDERTMKENLKFDIDYYLGDFHEDEEIQRLISYKPFFYGLLKKQQQSKNSSEPFTVTFTEQEQEKMRRLKNQDYVLIHEQATYLGLIDLIYAYCYNHRITESENTVESAWCIAKLSCLISSFEHPSTVKSLLTSLYRRSLCYPLYRNFALAEKIHADTTIIFKLGKRMILKCLLEIKELFDFGGEEGLHVFNRVWVDDYCCWVMNASDKILISLASELNHTTILKSDLNFDLEEIERLSLEEPDEPTLPINSESESANDTDDSSEEDSSDSSEEEAEDEEMQVSLSDSMKKMSLEEELNVLINGKKEKTTNSATDLVIVKDDLEEDEESKDGVADIFRVGSEGIGKEETPKKPLIQMLD
ncbi:Hsp90 cochaperone shq1 [Nowakowskiella sp. JEL0407]|nr:Hsp90 cochaperone shq1 [Nowakowskiella sp. JEL0407]